MQRCSGTRPALGAAVPQSTQVLGAIPAYACAVLGLARMSTDNPERGMDTPKRTLQEWCLAAGTLWGWP